MAKKRAGIIGGLTQLPITKITIATTPKEFMQNPPVYTRLDGIFAEHYGLVSFPKPQELITCEDVIYLGLDLCLIKQDTWKLYSFLDNQVLHDTGQANIIDTILFNDLSIVFTTQNNGYAVYWNANRTQFNTRTIQDIAGVKSLASFQGRLFALKGSFLLYSVPDFYGSLITGQDLFDYNNGAGHTVIDNPLLGFNSKMFLLVDSLLIFGDNGILVVGIRTTPNLSFSITAYPENIGRVLYVDRNYVITNLGLFQLKGFKLQPLHLTISDLLSTITGGGIGFYGARQFLFVSTQELEYSFYYLPVYQIWATYPQKLKRAWVYGTNSYGFDGSKIYKLFSGQGFYPVKASIDIKLPYHFYMHEVEVHGNFGIASVKVNNTQFMTRRAHSEYRRFYKTRPLKGMKFKLDLELEDAIIKSIAITGHAGRKT